MRLLLARALAVVFRLSFNAACKLLRPGETITITLRGVRVEAESLAAAAAGGET